MLAEGTAIIKDAKGTVEKGVNDAKAIYKEVTGLWSWIQSLFGKKPTVNLKRETVNLKQPDSILKPELKSELKKNNKQPTVELTYEEFQAQQVHEICDHLKTYFESIRILKAHCQELEQQSLTTDKVADSAIDRIELEWQMKQLATQVKEAMIYTPERLGLQALYSRFLEMYDQILEEQEFARALKAKKERDEAWRHDYHQRIFRAKLGYAIVVAMATVWMMGLFSVLCASSGCG